MKPVKQRRTGVGVNSFWLYRSYSVRMGWLASSRRTRFTVEVCVSDRQYNMNESRSVLMIFQNESSTFKRSMYVMA